MAYNSSCIGTAGGIDFAAFYSVIRVVACRIIPLRRGSAYTDVIQQNRTVSHNTSYTVHTSRRSISGIDFDVFSSDITDIPIGRGDKADSFRSQAIINLRVNNIYKGHGSIHLPYDTDIASGRGTSPLNILETDILYLPPHLEKPS